MKRYLISFFAFIYAVILAQVVPTKCKAQNLKANKTLTIGSKLINAVSDDSTLSGKSGKSLVTEGAVKRYIDNSSVYLNVKKYGAKGNDVTDDTQAFNNCFAAARAIGCFVYIPAGIYRVGQLNYTIVTDNNNQGSHPRGLVGEGYSSMLKAKTGFTGTMIKANNCAYNHFSDFLVDGNNTAITCLETGWLRNGPSAENEYTRVKVQRFTSIGWNADNDNESPFVSVAVRLPKSDTCIGLSLEASGGTIRITDCSIVDCWLRITAQNSTIIRGFFCGIRFSENQTGFNKMQFIGCQFYYSSSNSRCFYMANKGLGHYLSSLELINCWFTGAYANTSSPANGSLIDVATVGGITLRGTTILESAAGTQRLLATSCVFSSVGLSNVLMDNVDYYGLNAAMPTGFRLVEHNTMKGGVGLVNTQFGQVTYSATTTLGALAGGNWYSLIADNVLEENVFYILSVYWNHVTVGYPYIVNTGAIVSGTSSISSPSTVSAIGSSFINHAHDSAYIGLRYTQTGNVISGIQFSPNFTVASGSSITVKLTKISSRGVY